jgi:SMC interacting uncharacterized protein involved in chromosome segregation
MKTRWYFIIAGAAVLGFAAWYQDFHRRDSQRREQLAAEQTHQRAAEAERLRLEQIDLAERVRREAEDRRRGREVRAHNEALAQSRREEWESQRTAVREENAALRVSRDRLVHEIESVEASRASQERERTAIAAEDEFLQHYITAAAASAARIEAVALKVEKFLATAAAPEPERRPR